VCPADGPQAIAALVALADRRGPAYLRLPGQPVPGVTSPGEPFAVGPLQPLRDGRNLCVLTTGALVAPALGAADRLLGQGIFAAVIHAPTVRPLDEDAVRLAARRTGRVLVCEEHGPAGGLGDAVRRALQGQPVAVDAICFPGAGEDGDSLRTTPDAIFLRAMDLMEW
jgi:transketolase